MNEGEPTEEMLETSSKQGAVGRKDDLTDDEDDSDPEEAPAAQALLELGNASKSKKGKKSRGKRKVKRHEAAVAEDDHISVEQSLDSYQDDGNVEAAVMHYVGGTLNQDNDKKRKYENDMSNLNDILSNQPWEKFLNDEINEPSNTAQPHSDDYNLFTEQTARQPAPSSSSSQKKRRRVAGHAATSNSVSNVDPALEHLDDAHNTEDFSKNQQLVEQAMLHASAIARTLGGGSSEPNQSDHHSMELMHHHGSEPSLQVPVLDDMVIDRKKTTWTGDGSESGGSFSKDEMAEIDQFMLRFCDSHGLSRQQLCERVWSSERKKDNFWDAVAAVLPHRTRSSVYKHVRRKYHVFRVRGKWTADEDAELGHLVEIKGAQWKTIGLAMARMPEDCRDRWRNYIKCGNQRQQNKWTPEEEERLKEVVAQVMHNDANGEVNWTIVSEYMGGTRSRIQCRYKWNKLSKRENISRIDSMNNDDKLRVLSMLKSYPSEEQVNWDTVSVIEGKSQWTGKDIASIYYRLKAKVPDVAKKTFFEAIDAIVDDLQKQTDGRTRNDARDDQLADPGKMEYIEGWDGNK
jgi:Myb-like DNA-binding protein REB1